MGGARKISNPPINRGTMLEAKGSLGAHLNPVIYDTTLSGKITTLYIYTSVKMLIVCTDRVLAYFLEML